MKTIGKFFAKAIIAAAFAMVLASCGNAEDSTASDSIIEFDGTITSAATLAKALELDINQYIARPDNGSRAISAEKQNDVTIDVTKWMESVLSSSSSMIFLNAISATNVNYDFDKEYKLNLKTIPESLKILFSSTKYTEDNFFALINSSKIKMHRLSDDEYEICINYSMSYENEKSGETVIEPVYSYVYVKGNSVDNLETWFYESGHYESFSKEVSDDGEKFFIIRSYEEESEYYSYLKIGIKDNKNSYVSIYGLDFDEEGGINGVASHSIFKDSNGFYSEGEAYSYFGLNDFTPEILAIEIDSKVYSNPKFYKTPEALNDDELEQVNFYTMLHDEDEEDYISYDNLLNPIYYSSNKDFYGIIINDEDTEELFNEQANDIIESLMDIEDEFFSKELISEYLMNYSPVKEKCQAALGENY